MSDQETWKLETATAEKYEEVFVPALFAGWAEILVDSAGFSHEKTILDVACGTGIVARTAKERLNGEVNVTGVDLNPAMLEIARRISPDISWVEGNAQELPFNSQSFDAVLCQAGLMFFPDKVAALLEMYRVLRQEGKLVVHVWGPNEAYSILTDILMEVSGPESASIMHAPFVLEDKRFLQTLFDQASIAVTEVQTHETILKAPSLEQWLQTELESWALAGKVEPSALLPQAREKLQKFCFRDGAIEIPMKGHVVLASKSE